LEEPGTSIYDVFIALLPATVDAHKNNNTAQLKIFYEFAAWCFHQKAKHLWNAAAVVFYEHLADYPATRMAMHRWVKPDIYRNIRPLLEQRIDTSLLLEIDQSYGI